MGEGGGGWGGGRGGRGERDGDVSRLSLERRKAIGHQREDFILHCEYAGYECDMT